MICLALCRNFDTDASLGEKKKQLFLFSKCNHSKIKSTGFLMQPNKSMQIKINRVPFILAILEYSINFNHFPYLIFIPMEAVNLASFTFSKNQVFTCRIHHLQDVKWISKSNTFTRNKVNKTNNSILEEKDITPLTQRLEQLFVIFSLSCNAKEGRLIKSN